MIRRNRFIAAGITTLLSAAVAKAQKPTPSNRVSLDGRMLNNECPTCGTMAEPFNRPLAIQMIDSKLGMIEAPFGPTWNIVRCKFCNNAFYQDEVKP